MTEATAWKTVAVITGLLLAGCVTVNLVGIARVPPQVTAFLFGCLAALATGHSIVNPRTSLVLLDAGSERSIRRRQYQAGMVISILLALALLIPQVRSTPPAWALLPVILLAPGLFVREFVLRKRRKQLP